MSASEGPAGTGATVAVAGGPGQAGAPPVRLGQRAGRSPRDMVFSLLVLLIPIALLLTFYRVVLSGDAPIEVDPSSTIQQAQSAGAFPVAVPGELGDDWHVVTANYRTTADGGTLRLGYVAPDDQSALVIQSNIDPTKLVPAEVGKEAKPIGTVRTGDAPWRAYESRPGETALIRSDPSRTIIVLGTTDEKHLNALAAAFG